MFTQILQDFITQDKVGFFCRYGNFYLDPQEAVLNAVISHAHGDHAVSGNHNVFCTAPTKAFMEHRYKRFAAGTFNVKTYKEKFNLNGVDITFYPAGHILGSALVLMEYLGVKYLYTGDYKLEEDSTCEPIELMEADVLLTESTFANAEISHPSAIEEIKKLNAVEANIMLGAYALGKSQRLIALINQHCIDKTILVNHTIMPFVKIYESFGIKMGNYQPYDRKLMKQSKGGMVYLVSPMVFRNFIRALNVVRIFASGWKGLQSQNEVKLYISDHVDWKAILETISIVKPTEVWTTHGNGAQLQEHYKDKLVVKMLNG